MSKCLKYGCAAILTLLLTISPTQAGVDISQSPLVVGGGAPDNLVLVPSVEWPTINSVANLGSYDSNKAYVGYFDADKCYLYNYNAVETERYFYPSVTTSNHLCTVGNKLWSGNFLNWAATQTIDPFRSAMTGGYRVKDTTNETWLEKARHEGSGGTSIFPNLRLPTSGNNATLVQKSTPFNKNHLQMRIQGLGNKMRFSLNGTADAIKATNATHYNPASTQNDNTVYEVSVRVKVCVPGLLETNCKPYGSYYKPEGLMQEYAGRLRYSVFGYLNHSDYDYSRDGAVLRAKQKSIGPSLANLNNEVKVDNPLKEWNPSTGVLLQNPSPTDASATSSAFGINIQNSGVINYLNKFGQMTTQAHKSFDPVSELFYAGLRYLRNQGNVSAYSNMTGANAYNYADGFPVITAWDDPFQASCQANALLGIGDIYTHRDKNLPGNTGYRTDEPTMPGEVSSDPLNVVSLTNKIGQLEGLGDLGASANFTGRNNSAYMAGLAWYANTSDLRPDLPGKQTASTYWVDVLEAQSLEGMGRNQYALAAKYGGFSVPEDFNPATWTGALPEAWWHTNTDTLTPFGSRGNGQAAFKRPDNFFVAGQATQMVDSLKKAFERIISELTGSGASLAANSAKLESGTRVYQALFYSKAWRGDIHAFDINATTGALSSAPVWSASAKIPNWESRKIFLRDKPFKWGSLTADQKVILGSSLVDYLHGDAAHEQRNGGTFRDRTTLLGDIVHSQPILVGKPNPKLYASKSFSGAASYTAFAAAKAGRTSTLYVGANDGMLHGFNADTGVETYALVPSAVITDKLKQLSESDYQHHYFVDGELTVADVYIDSQWKTVLVGSLGRGGKGVFALDVTDPDKVEFLWEKSATDIPALGNVLGKPLINQTADGVWQVVFGNGSNGTGDRAQLLMINISTGTVDTVDTGESGNNGLSTVNGWSTYGDGITDLFYAGDFKGNVWRIPVGGSAFKLFTAKDADNNAQPITASPLIGKDPSTGKIWLFVGTGRYLAEADITNTAAQTWYGIKDEQTFISDRSSLVKRAVVAEGVINDFDARVIETGMVSELVGKSGWYIDLPTSGERMVTPNFFQGSVLIGTSRIPDGSDICSPTGKGFIMAINPFTGGRLDKTFFDITGDKLFNDFDTLSVNGIPTVISGIGFDSSPNNPIFVGNIMQVVKDNGKTNTILTQGMSSDAGRTSWREIINY